jgi:hypothetical protein
LADAEEVMTLDEAKKLCDVFKKVDGYCRDCAFVACRDASALDLGFRWFVEDDSDSKFPHGWRVSVEEIAP